MRLPFRIAMIARMPIAVSIGALVGAAPARALPAATGAFAAEVAAFGGGASETAASEGGTLFLGSSSMRLWDVKRDFAALKPVNHGFGGAQTADLLANYDLLVAGQRPAAIIVYVGENDIVGGRDADAVAADVTTLLARLRRDFPAARIAWLSMKASPARRERRDAIARVNARLGGQAGAGGFDYLDVASSLNARDGIDPGCFRADGIHLSAEGYGRWRAIVARYLGAGEVAAEGR